MTNFSMGSPLGPGLRATRQGYRSRQRPQRLGGARASSVGADERLPRRGLTALAGLRIIVLDGDETGQELLEQAVRVLDPAVTGIDVALEHFDLSLASRRETGNEVVARAASAMREAGFGLKAATVTPEGADDVGSPNRHLREQIDGKVIIRTCLLY